MLSGVIRSMRPKQWTKNLFVLAGLLFTIGDGHTSSDYARSFLAFVIFCAVSGGCYIINDIIDIKEDRLHPAKKNRPIASGELPVSQATSAALIILTSALLGAWLLDYGFSCAAAAYAALMVVYSRFLKRFVIIDVLTISAGFVLRAVAGALVINVLISPWLILCTVLLTLFLGFSKRRGELLLMADAAQGHRANLEHYSPEMLDQMITVTAAAGLIAYSLYTFAPFSKTAERYPAMMATIPFVIYGFFRYFYLIHSKQVGDAPENALLSDKPLLINVVLWGVASAAIMLFGG